jgi:hypothetical protein
MPYKIIKNKDGYYVENANTKKKYSKNPLKKENALKQRKAIIISELKRKGKI